jgi:TubC N-terminal docking domain
VTAAVELVARLRARGVALEADPPNLVVSPAGAVTPAEVRALKRHKAEVLALLSAPARPWVDVAPAVIRETLGADPAEHDVALLRFDVVIAVRQLEAEIITGIIGLRPLLVHGRPLADWLDLADVARLLRLWTERPHA